MVGVQPRHEGPHLVADRVLREVPQPSAGDVPAGVAGQRVEPDERDVPEHEEGAEAHVAPLPVLVAERQDRVVRQDQRDQHRGVPEVAVDVLQDQREPRLARVGAVRLRDRARGRREPEGPVVGLAVVVAAHPEAQREDQDDQRGRQAPPAERRPEVGRAGGLTGVGQARRVERREVRRGVEVVALEGAPGREDHEPSEHDERREGRQPPAIRAERLDVELSPGGPVHACRHRCPSLTVAGPARTGAVQSGRWRPDVKEATPTCERGHIVESARRPRKTGAGDREPSARAGATVKAWRRGRSVRTGSWSQPSPTTTAWVRCGSSTRGTPTGCRSG